MYLHVYDTAVLRYLADTGIFIQYADDLSFCCDDRTSLRQGLRGVSPGFSLTLFTSAALIG